jgi:short-subunit dehydrogenase
MRRLEGRTAVVTGAASGIGKALAEKLAQEGCNLALCDRNEAGLAEVASQVEASGRRVSRHVVDVSNKERMLALVDEVLAFHGGVHLVLNNAGVTVVSSFEKLPLEDFEWLMGVNFWGVVYGCKFFLPALLRAEEAHIVNISSIFGIIGVPLQSSYCASKFAVRGFSESIRAELTDTNVGVTSVHPGGIATNIARDGKYVGQDAEGKKKGLVQQFQARAMPPAKAAERIVEAVKKNRSRIVIAPEAYALDFAQRLSPRLGGYLTAGVWKRMQDRL